MLYTLRVRLAWAIDYVRFDAASRKAARDWQAAMPESAGAEFLDWLDAQPAYHSRFGRVL